MVKSGEVEQLIFFVPRAAGEGEELNSIFSI